MGTTRTGTSETGFHSNPVKEEFHNCGNVRNIGEVAASDASKDLQQF